MTSIPKGSTNVIWRDLSRQRTPTRVFILHQPGHQDVFLQDLYTHTNSTYYQYLKKFVVFKYFKPYVTSLEVTYYLT